MTEQEQFFIELEQMGITPGQALTILKKHTELQISPEQKQAIARKLRQVKYDQYVDQGEQILHRKKNHESKPDIKKNLNLSEYQYNMALKVHKHHLIHPDYVIGSRLPIIY